MKKTTTKKLSLHKTSLRVLGESALGNVAGGAYTQTCFANLCRPSGPLACTMY
jgi:hypothetical protein